MKCCWRVWFGLENTCLAWLLPIDVPDQSEFRNKKNLVDKKYIWTRMDRHTNDCSLDRKPKARISHLTVSCLLLYNPELTIFAITCSPCFGDLSSIDTL